MSSSSSSSSNTAASVTKTKTKKRQRATTTVDQKAMVELRAKRQRSVEIIEKLQRQVETHRQRIQDFNLEEARFLEKGGVIPDPMTPEEESLVQSYIANLVEWKCPDVPIFGNHNAYDFINVNVSFPSYWKQKVPGRWSSELQFNLPAKFLPSKETLQAMRRLYVGITLTGQRCDYKLHGQNNHGQYQTAGYYLPMVTGKPFKCPRTGAMVDTLTL